jgi:adenine-specific DNA-methyltransferase
MGLPEPYYHDGTSTIYCGDALAVLAELPAASVQLILTDPPYYNTKTSYLGEKLTWDRQWKTPAAYLAWLKQMALEWRRVLAPNGSVYCFASPQMAAYVEVMLGEVFHVIQRLTWRKPPYSTKAEMFEKDALRMFFPASEAIVFCEQAGSDEAAMGESGYAAQCGDLHCQVYGQVFGTYLRSEFARAGATNREIAALFPSRTGGLTGNVSNWLLGYNCPTKEQYLTIRRYLNARHGQEYSYLRQEYEDLRQEYEDLRQEYEDLRRPFFAAKDRPYTDCWDFATVPSHALKHPCQKPLGLLRHIIATSSREGDHVLDCCAGSFATLEAAKQLKRQGIGIEVEPRWCQLGASVLAQGCLF